MKPSKQILLNISDIAELTDRSIPAVSRWIEIHQPDHHAVMRKTGRPVYTRDQAKLIEEEISESMKPKSTVQPQD